MVAVRLSVLADMWVRRRARDNKELSTRNLQVV